MALKKEFPQVEFVIADVEAPEAQPLLQQFEVYTIPRFIVLAKGKTIVADWDGATSAGNLRTMINKALP